MRSLPVFLYELREMNVPSGFRLPRLECANGGSTCGHRGRGVCGPDGGEEAGAGAVRLTVIDRRNHHLFQPLLYQVATAALSPAQIASPIRRILSRYPNVEVLLGEVERVETEKKQVVLKDGSAIGYDYLIVATGATHSYFGHGEWEKDAPGLKSIEDALTIRRRFLLAFERAEREKDLEARRAELTFVIVGGGPTGVELAGAMIEIARDTIPRDFRAIDTTTTRVILVEANDRLLGGFPLDLAQRAARDLAGLGVELRLSCRVTGIDSRCDGATGRERGKGRGGECDLGGGGGGFGAGEEFGGAAG